MSYQKYDVYKATKIDYVGDIPSAWQIKPLFALAKENKVQNRGNFIDNVLSLSYGRIVRRNIEENMGLLPKSFETYQIIQDGYIVLRLTDLQNDKKSLRVGRATEEGIITSAYLGLIPTKGIYSQYFYYLLHAYDINKVFYNMVGGVRQSMGYSDFKRMPIVLPSIEEQKAIADFIDKKTSQIDNHIEKRERLIALLKERRTAIINKAVTRGLDENVKLKDSGIAWLDEIPEHWETRKIKRLIIKNIGGVWGAEPLGNDKDLVCVRVADMDYDALKFTTSNLTVRKITSSEHKGRLLQKDDLVLEKSGGGEKTPVGRVVLFNLEINAVCSNFMNRIKVNRDVAFPKYLLYVFNTLSSNKEVIKHIKQTTGIQNLDIDSYFSVTSPLPTMNEQKAIVQYIEQESLKAQKIILTIEDEILSLKEYRQSLISNAVTGKIRVI